MKTAQPNNIDEYIAGFPPGVQENLHKIRRIIKKAAPDAEEAIKYRMPTFVSGGNLVHFAAFQNHIGFYPTPSGIEEFKDELASFESAKGSVQFPLDKPIPFGLIEKIVKFRVKETQEKMPAKKRKNSCLPPVTRGRISRTLLFETQPAPRVASPAVAGSHGIQRVRAQEAGGVVASLLLVKLRKALPEGMASFGS
jgi:uncharacterized protein YdhG (YjbR/CyaY superfamily)